MADDKKTDLILPPGTHAYMQDTTKGIIKVYRGPTVVNKTAQEVPVIYDAKSKAFKTVDNLDAASRKDVVIVEGHYGVLLNPSKKNEQPNEGSSQASAELSVGHKVNIRGPAMFALWPGQEAEVIRGHHLHSNEYLLARVYDEAAARENWGQAVVRPATGDTKATALPVPPDLTVGKLLIIRGTDVSFYIPPTGISVVRASTAAAGEATRAIYVREALTLERLEYAILIGENGKKRYERGPNVVFPEPTEEFMEAPDDKGNSTRKFRAIELNDLQGIHLKAIADYVDDKGAQHKTGEELFVTGKDTAIYYPREEEAAVKYDGKVKHFATAIPNGEGRYVMNRVTGEIRTVPGPAMLLPDPRTEVIVRRVLTDRQCEAWYPGNTEALEYNRQSRAALANLPSTRSAPSEGDILRSGKRRGATTTDSMTVASTNYLSNSAPGFGDSSRVSREQTIAGDEFSRSASYTQPRTITLNTKYEGVPRVMVRSGYSVLVVDAAGNRRVEQGPVTLLLDYDETLEEVSLSTGKPKNTDSPLRTVFLRTENNQVTDVVTAETSDHVAVGMKLSYRVGFSGADRLKWFSVENYVKHLCDHARSVIKGKVKQIPIEQFYANSTDLIRAMILQPTPMAFAENGLVVADVEVLTVEISDPMVRDILGNSQRDVVKGNVTLAMEKRNNDLAAAREVLARDREAMRVETVKIKTSLEVEESNALSIAASVLAENELTKVEEQKKIEHENQAVRDITFDADQARVARRIELDISTNQRVQTQRLEALKAEVEATVAKFEAAGAGFSEAIVALSNDQVMVKVAEALNIQSIIGGGSVSEAFSNVFKGTRFEQPIKKLLDVAHANGTTSPETRA